MIRKDDKSILGIYVFLNKAKARIESELENLKRKVNKI